MAQAKARIWPWLSYMCRIRSTAAHSRLWVNVHLRRQDFDTRARGLDDEAPSKLGGRGGPKSGVEARRIAKEGWTNGPPLSSEFDMIETVKAKFGPWLELFFWWKSVKHVVLSSPRSLAGGKTTHTERDLYYEEEGRAIRWRMKPS